LKILLDENLPHELRFHLSAHEAFTVRYLGWDGLKNGALLRTTEEAGFEAFLTADQGLDEQNNRATRRIAVVLLTAQKIEEIVPYVAEILKAFDFATPGSFQIVECTKR
jgi:hypothetical protein